MRIVHVSNFTVKANGERFYSTEYKLNNGFTRLGHHVFSFSDRDIARSYLLGIRAAGRSFVNKKLQLVCRELRPDLLVLGHAALISPATVKAIRSEYPAMRVAHWNCDSLSFAPRTVELLKTIGPVADATFVTTAGEILKTVSRSCGRTAYMPNPVDGSIEAGRAFEDPAPTADLVFVGSADPERIALCKCIQAEVPGLKFEIRGMAGYPPVHGAELVKLLGGTRMGLALSRPNDAFLYSSDRVAQLMGNGVLTFIDARSGFDSLFAADEFVSFSGAEDLISKLRKFKADDGARRDVAQRGWQKVHQSFSATLVAKWIVETTFGLAPTEAYAWPTAVYGA
jgi:hypothetical protein